MLDDLRKRVQCEGKIGLDAVIAKKIAKKKKRQAYRCIYCNEWHVGQVPIAGKPNRKKLRLNANEAELESMFFQVKVEHGKLRLRS